MHSLLTWVGTHENPPGSNEYTEHISAHYIKHTPSQDSSRILVSEHQEFQRPNVESNAIVP